MTDFAIAATALAEVPAGSTAQIMSTGAAAAADAAATATGDANGRGLLLSRLAPAIDSV
jgi:hypothetical protein